MPKKSVGPTKAPGNCKLASFLRALDSVCSKRSNTLHLWDQRGFLR